jgi:type IV pilus assembly protein PilC
MAQIGDNFENLNKILKNVEKYYADESSLKIKSLTTLIEPIIIVMMDITVEFIVMAMMQPIFDISTTIH